MKQIRLPKTKDNERRQIEFLVDSILAAKKANLLSNTNTEEGEIDKLVYKLYGLTENEIRIVEGTK